MCEKQTSSMLNQTIEDKDEENQPVLSGGGKPTEKDSVTRAKSVLSRVMRLAQRYLIDPMGRQRTEEKSSQVKTRQRSPAPGRVLRSRTSASLTKAQIRSRRRGQQEGRAHQPTLQGSGGDVTVTDPAAGGKSDGAEQTFRRAATEPLGKAARHHGNHILRVKSLRLLRSGKNPSSRTPPPSSSFPPPSLRSSTLPPISSIPSSNPPSSGASQSREEPEQQDTPSMAFIRELSSRHQISVPLRDARESTLI
ncbi:uncharacterized protein LOC133009025 [Limanda limanda]|uniref:uncharacterized protein LOC133009025 n=1 Tax=Limanda limanda TaxID=27771 RepID=UPI0029C6D706|nr:uncharacterized protein LOC133009025 [Limanda limanda]